MHILENQAIAELQAGQEFLAIQEFQAIAEFQVGPEFLGSAATPELAEYQVTAATQVVVCLVTAVGQEFLDTAVGQDIVDHPDILEPADTQVVASVAGLVTVVLVFRAIVDIQEAVCLVIQESLVLVESVDFQAIPGLVLVDILVLVVSLDLVVSLE